MDCHSFESSLLDLLYDELDARRADEMTAHARECATCSTSLAKLERTRELYRPALLEPPQPFPASLEAKILAAAATEAAMAAPARSVKAVPIAPPAPGAKIFRLFARPELAIAATLLLFVGGVFFLRASGQRMPEARSVSAGAPAAAKADDRELALASASAAPFMPAVAATAAPEVEDQPSTATATATATASALALATPPPPPAARHRSAGKGASLDDEAPGGGGPRLAGSATDPLATARAVAKSQGCAAAAPQYDRIVQDNTGTELGSRAALEIARCYKDAGQVAAARPRYGKLAGDPWVGSQANTELASFDGPAAPSTPRAVTKARPAKQAAPAATKADVLE